MEQQFLRAQRLESIGTLAGGIAHDLNNVFTPIMLGVEMLKQDVKDPDGREVLETVLASARRGAEMVRQVLSFARGMEGRRVELDAKGLVADVARIARDAMPPRRPADDCRRSASTRIHATAPMCPPAPT
ncbi:MAG: histidine kinase dimerization/phospho-acceptor domain-containing protein [Acidobacteriota bacterium]|nr:histidine kinase dimerization/phospho-acceptor domain-containing protein [Acidobacteriota bacterium]